MKVNTSIGTIHIWFQHETEPIQFFKNRKERTRVTETTTCHFSDPAGAPIISQKVRRDRGDRLDKDAAIKYALKKTCDAAIHNGLIQKKDLYVIYDAMRERGVSKHTYIDKTGKVFLIDKMSRGHLREALKSTLKELLESNQQHKPENV